MSRWSTPGTATEPRVCPAVRGCTATGAPGSSALGLLPEQHPLESAPVSSREPGSTPGHATRSEARHDRTRTRGAPRPTRPRRRGPVQRPRTQLAWQNAVKQLGGVTLLVAARLLRMRREAAAAARITRNPRRGARRSSCGRSRLRTRAARSNAARRQLHSHTARRGVRGRGRLPYARASFPASRCPSARGAVAVAYSGLVILAARARESRPRQE
jgi:hypothetical protein